jgi:hypothetical protein
MYRSSSLHRHRERERVSVTLSWAGAGIDTRVPLELSDDVLEIGGADEEPSLLFGQFGAIALPHSVILRHAEKCHQVVLESDKERCTARHD